MSGFSSRRSFKSGREWRKRYYICGARNTTIDGCRALLAPAADLEAAVLQLVFTNFLDPQPFAAFLAAVQAALAVADHGIRQQTLARDITRTERAISDLVELVGQGIAVEEIGRRLRGREAELREFAPSASRVGQSPTPAQRHPRGRGSLHRRAARPPDDRRRFRPALGAAPGHRQPELRPAVADHLQTTGGLATVVAIANDAWTTRHHHHFS